MWSICMVISPIQNFLRISNLRNSTWEWTMNWYQNISLCLSLLLVIMSLGYIFLNFVLSHIHLFVHTWKFISLMLIFIDSITCTIWIFNCALDISWTGWPIRDHPGPPIGHLCLATWFCWISNRVYVRWSLGKPSTDFLLIVCWMSLDLRLPTHVSMTRSTQDRRWVLMQRYTGLNLFGMLTIPRKIGSFYLLRHKPHSTRLI